MRPWIGAVILLAVVMAGCGGGDRPPSAGDARASVTSFLEALDHQDYRDACAQVPDDVKADLREAAVARFTPTGATTAQRHRQNAAARAQAATCPGALALTVRELGAPRIARLVREARAAPATWVDREHHVLALGDQDWLAELRDGDWVVITTNGLE